MASDRDANFFNMTISGPTSSETKIETRLARALELHAAGDVQGASALYRDVIREDPKQFDALHMLGLIAQQNHNPALALKLIEASLALNPQLAVAWHNRCLVLRSLDRKDEALFSAKQALALDPQLADAWDMAGSILREKRLFPEACAALERALALMPQNSHILNSYLVVLTAAGRLKEAWQLVKKIEATSSDDLSIPTAIGNLLKASGHPERAIPYFRKASLLKPDYGGALLNEAMAYLQVGDFEKGLELWEQRLDDKTLVQSSIPRWDGTYVEHLLLREDQGMGDALQCLRYIPLIKGRVGRITLQVTGLLKNLLAPNLPGIALLTLDDPTPAADATAQLMSLPSLCRTREDTIPYEAPYLFAETAWKKPWQERLKDKLRPLIGLVWGGNPGNRHDYNRAVNFEQLLPLINLGPQHFISLQKGPQRDPEALKQAGVMDADPFLDNFTSTAGLMEELDLVITICSSPVHLAGALGRPTWLLLCFDPHWVWQLDREDTPWYPNTRLFRQAKAGEWSDVIEKTRSELQKLLNGDRSVLKPSPWAKPVPRQNAFAVNLEDPSANEGI